MVTRCIVFVKLQYSFHFKFTLIPGAWLAWSGMRIISGIYWFSFASFFCFGYYEKRKWRFLLTLYVCAIKLWHVMYVRNRNLVFKLWYGVENVIYDRYRLDFGAFWTTLSLISLASKWHHQGGTQRLLSLVKAYVFKLLQVSLWYIYFLRLGELL